VTSFFIPGVAARSEQVESAYARLKTEVETDTGVAPTDRRILMLSCRRNGTDYEAKVGKRDAVDGHRVLAIFELGGGVYAIRCAGEGKPPRREPIVVGKRQVYAVTDFGD
jgi:hypothetical protein